MISFLTMQQHLEKKQRDGSSVTNKSFSLETRKLSEIYVKVSSNNQKRVVAWLFFEFSSVTHTAKAVGSIS